MANHSTLYAQGPVSIIQQSIQGYPISAQTRDGRVLGVVGHWNRNPTYGICLSTPDGRAYFPNEVSDLRYVYGDEARAARGMSR